MVHFFWDRFICSACNLKAVHKVLPSTDVLSSTKIGALVTIYE